MDFDTLVTKVLRREGGYVNNPADRGGETNLGISQRANPDIDVRNLTEAQARQIYYERYWKPLGADRLPENVRDLAFDTAVHHGVGTARAWLRETNNDPRALLERRRAALQKQGRRADQRQFLNGWMNRLAEFDVQPDSSPAPAPQVRQTARAAVLAAAAGRPTGTIAAPAVAPPSPVAEAPEAPAMRGPLSAVEQQALVDANRPRIARALDAASFDQRVRVGAQPSTLERYAAAVSGNTDNRLIRALIGMAKPEFPADPNWQVPWDKVNSYPRDVAVDLANSKSQAEFDAKLADLAEDEERTRAIMSGGTVSGYALMFAGEATSLSAYLAPAAALRAASGRIALAAAAGHRARAIGIGAAAGGGADLGLELTLQALEGEADAKSAVLTGAVGVMFGGLDAALITRGLQRLQPQIDQAAQERGVKIATAIDKLGDGATPQQVLDEVKRAEVEEIKQPLTEALTSVRDDRKFFDNPDEALDGAPAAAPDAGVLRQGPAPEHVPVRQAIEQALNSPALQVVNETSRATRHLLTHLQKILPQQVLDAVPVSFDGNVRGSFNSITRSISAPGQSGSTLQATGPRNRNDANVLAHEVVHAATDRVIIAVLDGVEGVSEGSVRAVQRLDQIRRELDAHLAAKGIRQRGRQAGADYAASDLLEFVAQVMNDVETRKALSEMPGGEFKNMLSAFADAVVRLLGLDPKTNDSALREAVALVEKIIKEGENPPGLTAANFIRSRPGLSGPSSPRFASEAGDVLDTGRVTSLEPGKTHVLFRGGPKGQAEAPEVPAGLLGPGRYFTGDPAAAGGYGASVGEYSIKINNPLHIEKADLKNSDAGGVVEAIAKTLYEKTDYFMTRGQARTWARQQVEDFAGIGDEEFGDMLRSAGFDSVVLTGNGVIVEANVPWAAQRANVVYNQLDSAVLQGPTGPAAKPEDEVAAFMGDPVAQKYGLTILPMGTPVERADANMMLSLYKKAEAWAAKNPMDDAWIKRADQLIDNSLIPAASTGLRLLKSKNPVARMMAAELLEDASGVAGKRRSTAALSKYMHERAFMGNALPAYNDAYSLWRNKQGGSEWSELAGRAYRDRFDRLIAEEIEYRRVSGKPVSNDPYVKAATDVLEAAYNRIRVAQQQNRTLGWQALPDTSVGYMPHKISPNKWLTLSPEQRQVVHQALTDQFINIEGWDMTFADQLASRYLERVQARATNVHDSPIGGASAGSAEIVEDALTAMGMSREDVRLQMQRFTRGAAGWTKGRLDLDLLKVYEVDGQEFRLLDVFETDQVALLRSQAGRASGEVALARHGIYGRPHMSVISRAMRQPAPGLRITDNEADAFDQVAAEFFNAPFGTAEPKWLENARVLNSVVRLGGIVYNQFAEFINAVAHVGLVRTLSGVASMGRMRSEIKALVRGEKVDNPLISSIERLGGAEFGTDAYRIVMPFDVPDHAYPTYGADTVTTFDRLVRGASYLQGKLSLWRTVHSVQQRAMAEQIVAKIGRYANDGGEDVALRQFGISPELQAAIKRDGVARYDNGSLVEFDVNKLQDPAQREELVQAVHRGVSQIIQGTFIGETGKWAHSGYLKMLVQFRTFSLTAMEKQWARQRNSRGVGPTLAILLASMMAAAPIYMARMYASSIGREDQEEFLEQRLQPELIVRQTLNYVALSGLAGDFLDAAVALSPDEWGLQMTGGRAGTDTEFVGNLIAPATSLVDDAWKALQNLDDPTQLLRVLPGSRLPYIVPGINALQE